MKRVLKSAISMVLSLAMILSAAACSAGQTPQESQTQSSQAGEAQSGGGESGQDLKGKTIRFLTFNHVWTETIKELIPEFEKETGAKINLESYTEDPLTQKLTVEFTSGASTVDVFITRPLQEGLLFNQNKWYEPLNSYIEDSGKTDSDYEWDDFLASYAKACTDKDGNIFGIPILSDLQLLIYRKDWFEEKGIKVPTNYEELETAAKAFTDPAKETYGVAARGQRSYAVTQYATFLYGFGGTFLKDGVSVLDSEEAVKAFSFYGKLLHDYGPPGTTNMSWPQTEAVFGAGKVAMLIESNAPVPDLLNKDKFDVYDKIGFATIPAGPAGLHPYATVPEALAINSTSKNKDAAWAFIQYLTNKKSMSYTSSRGITQTRNSVLSDPEVTKDLPQDYVEAMKKTAEIGEPSDRPMMTAVTEARDAIGEVIVNSINSGGTGDIASMAKSANDKVNELLKRDGEYGKK